MGDVHRTTDSQLALTIAIKILPQQNSRRRSSTALRFAQRGKGELGTYPLELLRPNRFHDFCNANHSGRRRLAIVKGTFMTDLAFESFHSLCVYSNGFVMTFFVS